MSANGTGDRSRNLSQFPFVLTAKLSIWKTQDVSLVEGGVAGMCEPLDATTARVS
jgi:hypothetical protein